MVRNTRFVKYGIESFTGKKLKNGGRKLEFNLSKGKGLYSNLSVKFKKNRTQPGWVTRTLTRRYYGGNTVNKKRVHLMNATGLTNGLNVSKKTKQNIINKVVSL